MLYDDVDYRFQEGFAGVKQGGKWGYIDKQGNPITSITYDDVGRFTEGFTGVKRDGLWGYLDNTGKEITPLIYQQGIIFPMVLPM